MVISSVLAFQKCAILELRLQILSSDRDRRGQPFEARDGLKRRRRQRVFIRLLADVVSYPKSYSEILAHKGKKLFFHEK